MEGEEFNVSKELMKKECENLIGEIDRLERRRDMLSDQLKNVLNLAFATANFEDSRQTRILTEATVRNSASMVHFFSSTELLPQILIHCFSEVSYSTCVAVVFFPAGFIAVGIHVCRLEPKYLTTGVGLRCLEFRNVRGTHVITTTNSK
jgi:hypothetical protein